MFFPDRAVHSDWIPDWIPDWIRIGLDYAAARRDSRQLAANRGGKETRGNKVNIREILVA